MQVHLLTKMEGMIRRYPPPHQYGGFGQSKGIFTNESPFPFFKKIGHCITVAKILCRGVLLLANVHTHSHEALFRY